VGECLIPHHYNYFHVRPFSELRLYLAIDELMTAMLKVSMLRFNYEALFREKEDYT
jgi:hypothetical protein